MAQTSRVPLRLPVRYIEAIRTIEPLFCLAPLGETGLLSLCSAARIAPPIRSREISSSYVLTHPINGFSRLLIHDDVPEAGQQLIAVRAAAMRLPPRPCRDATAATVVGLASLFHEEGLRMNGSAAWQAEVVDELVHDSLADLWHARSLYACMRWMDRLIPMVHPSAAPQAERPAAPAELVEIAREARVCGDYGMADAVAREAEKWAREQGDGDSLVSALVCRGVSLQEQGDQTGARRVLKRALQAAHQYDLRAKEGGIHHDLFMVEYRAGRRIAAAEHAEAAVDLYIRRTPHLLTKLGQDLGCYLVRQGYYTRALPLLRGLERQVRDPVDRIRLLGNLAIAEAGMSNRSRVEGIAAELGALALAAETSEGLAYAYANLGRAFGMLDMWARAVASATCSSETASLCGMAHAIAEATAVLDAARRGVPLRAPQLRLGDVDEDRWDRLVSACRRALEEQMPLAVGEH